MTVRFPYAGPSDGVVDIPRSFKVFIKGGHYYAVDYGGRIICRDSPTACIQEAVNAIGSGTVFIERGIYNISKGINIPTGIALIGRSTHT
ncbi:MAG: hypothetical protein ACP5HD_04920, partial [Thermoproteus sp.]